MGAEAYVADERRPRGSVPLEVHKTLVDEFQRTGSPPPANVISDITGIDPVVVRRALKQLCDDGVLVQPHGHRAPYIPLFRPDGTRVRPVLVEVGKEPTVLREEPKSTAEMLKELLRRVEEGEES